MACSYNFCTQELEAEGFTVSLRPAWATEEVCLRNLEMRRKGGWGTTIKWWIIQQSHKDSDEDNNGNRTSLILIENRKQGLGLFWSSLLIYRG